MTVRIARTRAGGCGSQGFKCYLRLGFLFAGIGSLVLISESNLPGIPFAAQRPADATKAEEAARAGNYGLAVQEYRKLARDHPRSAELWSNLGSVAAMGGDCQQALSALDKARLLNPSLFAPWYFSGLCHTQLHQDEKAATELRRAIKVNSRDANAWYMLAHATGNLGHSDLAFQAIVHALNIDAARPEGFYLAGKTALDLAATHYARVQSMVGNAPFAERLEAERDAGEGVLEAAIGHYQKAIQSAPRDPDIHFALGAVYLRAEKLPEAEAEVRKCLQLYPKSATASQTVWPRIRLALILARQNKTAEAREIVHTLAPAQFRAREEFDDALACAVLLKQFPLADQILTAALLRYAGDPALTEWKSRIASYSADSGGPDTESGAASWTAEQTKVGVSVRFMTVTNPSTGNFVAAAFATPTEYRKFREAFLRNDVLGVANMISPMVERLPAGPAPAFVLGGIFHWLSFGFYQQLGTVFPDSEPAQMLAAENFAAQGDTQQAIGIFQGLLEKDGTSPDLMRALARVYWKQGRWDDVLQIFASLLKLDPYDSTTLVNVGRIYSSRQELENAEINFRRAADLDSKLFEAHLGLGDTLRREGKEDAAKLELAIAAKLDPANPRPHYALSQIYRKLGQNQLADGEMQAFQRLQAQAGAEKASLDQRLVPVE